MWPDALDRFVRRARLRATVRAMSIATGIAVVAALPIAALIWSGASRPAAGAIAALGVIAIGVAAGIRRAPLSRDAAARATERRVPLFRNLLVTSVELRGTASPFGAIVWEDAIRVAGQVDLRRAFPLGRPVAFAAAAWLLAAAALTHVSGASPASTIAAGFDGAQITSVAIVARPPAYTGAPSTTWHDTDHVDVLAGTTLTLDVRARAASVRVLDASGTPQDVGRPGPGQFAAMAVARDSGYLAIEPIGRTGSAGMRRMVTVNVRPDRPPDVRIDAPAKDLYLADSTRTIQIGATATDDLALRQLRLRYTKISGSGENFTFTEGEWPLQVTRSDDRVWTGRAVLALGSLGLSAGDTLVYHAEAVDSLPGRRPTESDAWIVQIVAPGDVAMEGFATGDDRERYALSEQMIVLKTEQLQARRGSTPADAFNDEALGLAAMQRSVRASFVFMLGGELEDIEAEAASTDLHEEAEAQGEQDLAAGRMQNRGRQDVLAAIRRMAEASAALAVPDTAQALVAERAAVAALQRAFTTSRLILRTFTAREQIDLARRMTGNAKDEIAWRRQPPQVAADPRAAALERALDDLGTLALRRSFGPDEHARLLAVAVRILQADRSAAPYRDASGRVMQAASAIERGRDPRDVADAIAVAAVGVASLANQALPADAAAPPDPATRALRGAWADRVRREGPR